MASVVESAQFERDLRSASQARKRDKDASTKWMFGSRPLHGVRADMATGEPITGSASQRAKARPRNTTSDWNAWIGEPHKHNIVKAHGGNYGVPWRHIRSQQHVNEAIDELMQAGDPTDEDELRQFSPPSPLSIRHRASSFGGASGLASGVLYNFDRKDSPGRPVTLDIFVKPAGRDTEKLVEREYAVLDENGEALTGRKARRTLRKEEASNSPPPSAAAVGEHVLEDDGFELV